MQILFCDRCNQSIPASDLEEGTAGFFEGQVLCHQHLVLVHGGSPPGGGQAASPKGGGESSPAFRAVLFAVLIMLATGGGFLIRDFVDSKSWTLFRSAEAEGPSPEVLRYRELESSLRAMEGSLRAEVAGSAAEVSGLARRLTELEGGLQGVEELVQTSQSSSLDGQREVFQALQSDRQALQEVREEVVALKTQLSGFGEQLTRAARVGETAPPRGREVEAAGQETASRPTGDKGGRKEPAREKEEDEFNPARDQWIRTLRSNDPGARFTALVELTAIGGKKSAVAIADLLEDDDPFLRSYAAHSLGRLGVWASVGPLIDALEDADVSVRQAVLEALTQITGQGFGYRADASVADRKKSIRKWREWWRDDPQPTR